MWFLPLYLPKPLQWPACFVMIILGVAVYCHVLRTMRQLQKSSREIHTGKSGGRSPKPAPTRIGTGQDLAGAPRDASAAHAQNAQISISVSIPGMTNGRGFPELRAPAVSRQPALVLRPWRAADIPAAAA
jgi:hypothetical protein